RQGIADKNNAVAQRIDRMMVDWLMNQIVAQAQAKRIPLTQKQYPYVRDLLAEGVKTDKLTLRTYQRVKAEAANQYDKVIDYFAGLEPIDAETVAKLERLLADKRGNVGADVVKALEGIVEHWKKIKADDSAMVANTQQAKANHIASVDKWRAQVLADMARARAEEARRKADAKEKESDVERGNRELDNIQTLAIRADQKVPQTQDGQSSGSADLNSAPTVVPPPQESRQPTSGVHEDFSGMPDITENIPERPTLDMVIPTEQPGAEQVVDDTTLTGGELVRDTGTMREVADVDMGGAVGNQGPNRPSAGADGREAQLSAEQTSPQQPGEVSLGMPADKPSEEAAVSDREAKDSNSNDSSHRGNGPPMLTSVVQPPTPPMPAAPGYNIPASMPTGIQTNLGQVSLQNQPNQGNGQQPASPQQRREDDNSDSQPRSSNPDEHFLRAGKALNSGDYVQAADSLASGMDAAYEAGDLQKAEKGLLMLRALEDRFCREVVSRNIPEEEKQSKMREFLSRVKTLTADALTVEPRDSQSREARFIKINRDNATQSLLEALRYQQTHPYTHSIIDGSALVNIGGVGGVVLDRLLSTERAIVIRQNENQALIVSRLAVTPDLSLLLTHRITLPKGQRATALARSAFEANPELPAYELVRILQKQGENIGVDNLQAVLKEVKEYLLPGTVEKATQRRNVAINEIIARSLLYQKISEQRRPTTEEGLGDLMALQRTAEADLASIIPNYLGGPEFLAGTGAQTWISPKGYYNLSLSRKEIQESALPYVLAMMGSYSRGDLQDYTEKSKVGSIAEESRQSDGETERERQIREEHREIRVAQAPQEAQPEARAFLDEGYKHFNAKEYDEAIEAFTKAIDLNPEYAEAYGNRAASYNNQGNFDEAIKDYTRAIELKCPNLAVVYYSRGLSYRGKKDYEKAAQDYGKATELKPDYLEVYLDLGLMHFVLGKYEAESFAKAAKIDSGKTISYLTELIRLNPKHSVPYFYRGYVYNELKEYAKAIDDYTKYLESNPNDRTVYYNRALAYQNLGRHQEAITDATRAIELDVNYVSAYQTRGESYFEIKDYQKALVDLDKAIQLEPRSVRVYYYRGKVYQALGEFDRAIADISEV
ncbi:MAG: tetratricopeptide repeat protein, partial [Candidatus Omnitrophota bacterium]